MSMLDATYTPRARLDWRIAATHANAWKIAALATLAVWILVVGAAHEPWFDEAQAWLLARDSGLVELLTQRVRYEGSPGLWHVIVWFAIRGGLPYSQYYLLPAFFAVAGAAVVLWRSPFPPLMRLGIVFSYFFAYQYACLARSYSVDLLLIPLAAAWFAERSEKPLRYGLVIGLIANLNAHGFVAAAAMGVELAWCLFRAGKLNDRRAWLALAVAAGLGLLALASAWQPADNGYIRGRSVDHSTIAKIAGGFLASFINFTREAFIDRALVLSAYPKALVDGTLGFAIGIVALLPSVKLVAQAPARFVCGGIFALLVVFSVSVYASPWHCGLLYLFWVFAMWVSWPPETGALRKQVLVGFAIVALVQLVQTASTGIWDLSHTYSPARQTARFVDEYESRRPEAKVAAFGFKTFAMQPYWSGNKFANYKGGAAHPTWVDWRAGEPWNPFLTLVGWKRVLDAKPDLIVASLAELDGSTALLRPLACRSGYVETRRFIGTMNWRASAYEDDTLAIFEPGTCSRSERGPAGGAAGGAR